jgi:hypothetical protein
MIVHGTVVLTVEIVCTSCMRTLTLSKSPPPDSLFTGNNTQQASYWYRGMVMSIEGDAKRREWGVVGDSHDSQQNECSWCRHRRTDPSIGDAPIDPPIPRT